jgi:hypothetical protein
MERKAYPTDVSDAARALVAPYLTLMTEDAPLKAIYRRRGISRSGHDLYRADQRSGWLACVTRPKSGGVT